MMATAAGDGRIPFVSVDDIAEVAFKALTDEKSPNTERIIVGPELYNYDEVGPIFNFSSTTFYPFVGRLQQC
jgi:festuclavine dehydrogenase